WRGCGSETSPNSNGASVSKGLAKHPMTAHPIFHPPNHDHARCKADVLADAEMACAERGARLTPLRRRTLAALVSEHRPLGAYDVIERMGAEGTRPAPI